MINYIYIFSKVTTSLVLLFIIFIMGYLIFNSYKETDYSKNELEKKLIGLSELIGANTLNIESFQKQFVINKSSLQEIKDILDNTNKINNDLNISKNIEDIIIKIKELESQINKLNLNSNNKKSLNLISNKDQVISLSNFILEKYQIGQNVSNEIDLLEKIIPQNKAYIFEELRILLLKKFSGLEELKDLFDILTEKYVERSFLEKNQSLVIQYLSKFISIRPANLNIYENENLNFLMQAKQSMDSKKVKKALKLVLIIDSDRLYFKKWIEQVENYIKFMLLINEVKKID